MNKYVVVFEKTSTGYSCYVPDLPGCIATGVDREDAERNIYEAITFHLEGMKLEVLPIPNNYSEAEMVFFANPV